MVSSKQTRPAAYLASLPPERRRVIAAVREVIKKRLPKGFVETMNWGMLAYEVPLSRYPDTYNKQPLMYLALAAQKNNYAFYMTGSRATNRSWTSSPRRTRPPAGSSTWKELPAIHVARRASARHHRRDRGVDDRGAPDRGRGRALEKDGEERALIRRRRCGGIGRGRREVV